MTPRKRFGNEMDPSTCVEREARSLVSYRHAGMKETPPTAMLEAYTDLVVAAYEALDDELVRLHGQEHLPFEDIGAALGISRQSAWERYHRLTSGDPR